MKITAIVATNRRNGNTLKICESIIRGAGEKDHQTQIFNLYDYEIKDCMGCWKCVENNQCFINDDFEKLYREIKSSDCIILGAPCYWGNVPGKMKTFFDRHTGYAMYKPKDACLFSTLSLSEKIKTLLRESKKFGPEQAMRDKQFILVTPLNAPFPISHFSGDLSTTQKAMKIYVNNLKGKIIGKIIYTDTLIQFRKNKKKRIMKKAFKLGKSLNR